MEISDLKLLLTQELAFTGNILTQYELSPEDHKVVVEYKEYLTNALKEQQ